jgi:hypothetical protein
MSPIVARVATGEKLIDRLIRNACESTADFRSKKVRRRVRSSEPNPPPHSPNELVSRESIQVSSVETSTDLSPHPSNLRSSILRKLAENARQPPVGDCITDPSTRSRKLVRIGNGIANTQVRRDNQMLDS